MGITVTVDRIKIISGKTIIKGENLTKNQI